ncbi:MAG: NUDIX hydrolase [Bacillota bacterium]|nr:NUDIX hydrolase [Bacillota bacterium]
MKRVDRKKWHIGRFDIYMDTVENHGQIGPYSFVDIKPSVCVLVKVENKFLIMKEYRYPISSWEYEFPCGGIEENESPKEAAYRELLEETGYQAKKMESLGFFYPSFGSTTEKIYLFVAICDRSRKEISLDVLENIDCELVEEETIEQWIENGTIACGAAIVAWYRYEKIKANIS